MLTRLFEGGDPFLMLYGGKYYIYCTTENDRKLEVPNAFDTEKNGNDGFYVYVSNDLKTWKTKDFVLIRKTPWASGGFGHPKYPIITANSICCIPQSKASP